MVNEDKGLTVGTESECVVEWTIALLNSSGRVGLGHQRMALHGPAKPKRVLVWYLW